MSKRARFDRWLSYLALVTAVVGGAWLLFEYVRPTMFDWAYGDIIREIIRDMVKPDALKVDP